MLKKSKVQCSPPSIGTWKHWTLSGEPLPLQAEKRLPIFNRLSVFYVDLRNLTTGLGLDFIHQFHRLDDTDHTIRSNLTADFHKRFSIGRRRAIEGAHDWRGDDVKILIFRSCTFCLRTRMRGSNLRRRRLTAACCCPRSSDWGFF